MFLPNFVKKPEVMHRSCITYAWYIRNNPLITASPTGNSFIAVRMVSDSDGKPIRESVQPFIFFGKGVII